MSNVDQLIVVGLVSQAIRLRRARNRLRLELLATFRRRALLLALFDPEVDMAIDSYRDDWDDAEDR